VDGRSFLPNVCGLCIVAIYMVGGYFGVVYGKRLVVRLLRCWEYFWKRLLKIGDGLLNVWG
jgi:hypothetical protein